MCGKYGTVCDEVSIAGRGQELHEVIEYMNERQGKLMSMMERNQKLIGEVTEFRENCQEMSLLDDRISAEEVEGKRDTVVAEGGFTLRDRKNTATKLFRCKPRCAPLSENIPCPLPHSSRLRVRAAKQHRYRLISFFQVDGPNSSLAVPLWFGARRGLRAPMPRGVCDGLRLPCGAALAHWPLLDSNRTGAHTAMCAGGAPVLFSILLLLLLIYISHGGCRNVYPSEGVCVSFQLPKLRSGVTPSCPRHGGGSEILWLGEGAAIEKKRSSTQRVVGDTGLCVGALTDEPL